MAAEIDWTNTGNGEQVAIVDDPNNVGNYRSLKVFPRPAGGWIFMVNGSYRGYRMTRPAARQAAIEFAVEQIA